MQFVPDVTLRVRNNIDRFFDKSLTDLIRGIRNNKENEAKYISECIEEIKIELKQSSTFMKANAVEKLTYLQMVGYDISWAAFNIIEVMASAKFNEKRIGYLAASQAFNDTTEVLMLTTNLIRKDLLSSNLYDVGVAFTGLSCFITSDLARDLISDVVNLLSSSRTYTRKKAVLLLYKIYLRYPESLKYTLPRLKERLDDQDPGVQSAAVNVICELAHKNPRGYLPLEDVFFHLLTTGSNNWMLIKIIKLFGFLVPHEPKLGKKLLEPLTNLINNTSAMSLLYECINTVIAVLISISSEGPGDYTTSIQLCVQKLGVLIEDSDQNLKYLGLLAMGRILLTHPRAVQAHKDIILRCLDDKDESIRLRALDLLYGMVSKKNIVEIIKRLMEHIDHSEGSFYRDELLRRIISICSHNTYQHVPNFEWYISVLVELTKLEGKAHGVLIAEQLQDVSVRVQSIRHFSVSQMSLLINNAHQLLLDNNCTQRANIHCVLDVAAWICGEYAEFVDDVPGLIESMLKLRLSIIPGVLLSAYLQNSFKLYAFLLPKLEAENDWDAIDSLDNLLSSKLSEFTFSEHLEAQERACEFVELLKVIEGIHLKREKIGHELAQLFEGELNPVGPKAQRKVPLPVELDLDEWIIQPEPETPSSSSDIEQIDSAVVSRTESKCEYQQFDGQDAAENSVEPLTDSKRLYMFERESNPYYLKLNQNKSSSEGKYGGVDKTGARLNKKSDRMQNPSDIPGIIDLKRWEERESATLSWKKKNKRDKNTAHSENLKSKLEKQRKGKEPPISAIANELAGGPQQILSSRANKKKKRIDQRKIIDRSVLSSSCDSDVDGVQIAAEKRVTVNKGDEMPEGAVSSQDEVLDEEIYQITSASVMQDSSKPSSSRVKVTVTAAPTASILNVPNHSESTNKILNKPKVKKKPKSDSVEKKAKKLTKKNHRDDPEINESKLFGKEKQVRRKKHSVAEQENNILVDINT